MTNNKYYSDTPCVHFEKAIRIIGYDGNRKASITQRRNPVGESEPKRQMTITDKEELVRNNDLANNEYNQGPEEEASKSSQYKEIFFCVAVR